MSRYELRSHLIGDRYKNNKGYEFEIVGYIENDSRKRRIRFINTGYETISELPEIRTGGIMDCLEPSVCGVGIPGFRNASKHPLYKRWSMMLHRCYNENQSDYKYYGEKGVYVDKSWHDFRNYIRDIEKKENYEKMLENPNEWQIDKDFRKKNCYSNESTIIIKKSENVRERNFRVKTGKPKRIDMYDLDGNFIKRYSSIKECADDIGGHTSNICNCIAGKQKSVKKHTFKLID